MADYTSPHSNTAPDVAPRPARKRRRPAVVCAECRRRKIACDRKTPCGQCALHNVECVYVTGAVPPPYGRPIRPPPTSPGSQTGLASDGGRGVGTLVTKSGGVPMMELGEAKQQLEQPRASSSLGDDVPSEESGNLIVSLGERTSRFGGRMAKTRLFGRTHWMNNMDQFKDIHSLTHLVNFVAGSAIYRSMRMCKKIAQAIKAEEQRLIATPTAEGVWFAPQPRNVTDRLVDLYFMVFEPMFRVLHMPTFRREYHMYLDGDLPQPFPDVFMLKLLLVLALGSCFYDGPDADSVHDSLRISAARAIRNTDTAYCAPLDKHRLNMDTMQVYCLATIARQTNALEVGDDLIWFSAGGLLHTAFGMGYNRDPSHFKSLSLFQSEMRRRLWATVLELVIQSSLDQGMPPLISTDDYDCMPPSNLDDDQIEEDEEEDMVSKAGGSNRGSSVNRSSAKGQPDSVFTHSTMQRLLCRSLPVRLRITKALNGLGGGLSYDRALQLSSDLIEASRCSAALVKSAPLMGEEPNNAPTDPKAGRPSKDHAGFARLRLAFYELLTRRFHHALHSPFARKAANNVQFFYSRRARIETALKLLSYFRPPASHPHRFTPLRGIPSAGDGAGDPSRSDPCWRFLLMGRGLIKCTIFDIDATVSTEMILQLQEDYVPGTDMTMSQREIYETVKDIVRVSQERVETGETNVRGHVFYCGTFAQIEALIDGRPIRPSIMEAAQRAAAQATDALRAYATRKGVVLPEELAGGSAAKGDGTGDIRGGGGVGGGDFGFDATGDDADMVTVSPVDLHGSDPLGITTSVLAQNGTFTFNQLEEAAAVDLADVDSAVHLPSTDISATGSTNSGPWTDEWIVDPQGDFGYGNWFFPVNEQIGNDGP